MTKRMSDEELRTAVIEGEKLLSQMRIELVNSKDGDAKIVGEHAHAFACKIIELSKEILDLRHALNKIKNEYGPNHLSKYCRDVAKDALK